MARVADVVAVVVERNEAGEVTTRAVGRGEPLGVGDHARAYADNFLYDSRAWAEHVAVEEVAENGLRGAVAWSTGTGNWAVNGWR